MPVVAGLTHPDVGEVRAAAHGAQQRRLIEDMVARDGSAHAPPAIQIGTEPGRPDLLAVTVQTAEALVDATSLGNEPGRRRRVLAALLVDDGLHESELELGHGDQTGKEANTVARTPT